jgi:hypothetical protein
MVRPPARSADECAAVSIPRASPEMSDLALCEQAGHSLRPPDAILGRLSRADDGDAPHIAVEEFSASKEKRWKIEDQPEVGGITLVENGVKRRSDCGRPLRRRPCLILVSSDVLEAGAQRGGALGGFLADLADLAGEEAVEAVLALSLTGDQMPAEPLDPAQRKQTRLVIIDRHPTLRNYMFGYVDGP